MRFLGKLFLFLIIAVVALFAYSCQLNKEAKAYVEDAIPKITGQWNDQELINRASPPMLAAMKTRANVDNLFSRFRQLGALKQIDEPKGSAGVQTFTGKGVVRYGNYIVHAQFERGPATIRIQVLRENDVWKINGFHIDSNVLLK